MPNTSDPHDPAFRLGDTVAIDDRSPMHHVRTPAYVRGHSGRVVGIYGPHPNPESLAYGGQGLPAQWVYCIELHQHRLWEEYPRDSQDVLWVDIYEHWLKRLPSSREAAETAEETRAHE